MCDRWRNDFSLFALDMGERPDGFSIERIDVNGDYEPGNCIWIDKSLQIKNRRNTVFLTYKGRTQCMKDWANELGLNYKSLHGLIKYQHKTLEEIVNVP